MQAPASVHAPKIYPVRSHFTWVLIGLLLLGIAMASYTWLLPHGPMADYQVRGNMLAALNKKGQELWRYRFLHTMRESRYLAADRQQLGWIGDLGSGQKLLLVTAPIEVRTVGNDLVCFSASGQVEWMYRTTHGVRDAAGSSMRPPYYVNGIQVVRRPSPADMRIVVSSNHYMEQADQIAVLNTAGHLLAEYWHPGHLLHLGETDLAGIGPDQVLLGGVNNGNHQATMVVLDPMRMSGQSTPAEMADDHFRLVGMSPAHEQAVVLFPKSDVGKHAPYTRVANLWVTTADRIVIQVAEGTDEHTSPQLVYELDRSLQVIAVHSTDSFRLAHQKLTSEGQLDHALSQAELDQLKSAVIVRHE